MLPWRSWLGKLRRELFECSCGDQQTATEWQEFSVPDFKSRFDLTRKWAIPLLEQLDLMGVTARSGNSRIIRRS